MGEGCKVSLSEGCGEAESERASERGGGAETAKNESKNCVSGARKAQRHLLYKHVLLIWDGASAGTAYHVLT